MIRIVNLDMGVLGVLMWGVVGECSALHFGTVHVGHSPKRLCWPRVSGARASSFRCMVPPHVCAGLVVMSQLEGTIRRHSCVVICAG